MKPGEVILGILVVIALAGLLGTVKPRLFLPFRKPCQSSAERDRADGLVPAVERHLAGWRPAIGKLL